MRLNKYTITTDFIFYMYAYACTNTHHTRRERESDRETQKVENVFVFFALALTQYGTYIRYESVQFRSI